mmetsp:Transcript_20943/g.36041  ORF Transcript_20943/g.36041 Transcript_20943/m.36041 type:complete len:322 (+) Transcript_20943:105-1070(+)|eukprot:CAMPEP_0183726168 /NCGR_PEP_ID=MMETSP0737-20130205/22619_1 /TAXON_ID=385413 /ORGANISM="Thalassiosira miniscula, Strain CCMP1093" /LENGTH=321 /DNA_ID=CAMNT_0025957429 /DNA_START=42 /DNA_END=1007 /DNA_ORIENTATION=+
MGHNSVDKTPNQDVDFSKETLSFMMEQECTAYLCPDYLTGEISYSITCNQPANCYNERRITPADRMKIVDWCFEIVDQSQFDRETVSIAMNCVDRFVSKNGALPQAQVALHDRAEYQLVTITALYVAIKLNERVTFSSKDFAALSRGTYAVEEIEDMETQVLHGLSWRLCPPTSLQIANQILVLVSHQVEMNLLMRGTLNFIRDEVAFQTENAVRDYFSAIQRPSTIAFAAIMNAIEQVSQEDYECLSIALLRVLDEFPFDSPLILFEARKRLQRLVESGMDMEGHGAIAYYEETRMSDSSHRHHSNVFADSCDSSLATVS